MSKNTTQMRWAERVRREWYLFKVTMVIAGLPGRHAKEIIAELRGEIDAAAADIGLKRALDQLGPARVLSHGYLDGYGKSVPRVYAGLIAFAVLLYGWLFGVISHLEGMVNVAGSLEVSEPRTITSQWLLNTFYVEVDAEGIGAFGFQSGTVSILVTLAIFVIVPLIFARFWRVWHK